MNPLSFLRTHHKSLSVLRIYNGFINYLRIHYEKKIFLADSLLIHYPFLANSTHYIFWDHTKNSLFVREYTMNSQSFPKIHYGIIIFS